MNNKEKTLNSVSERILQNQTGKQEVFLDPASIIIAAKIVIRIVKLFKYCQKTPEEAVQVAYRLTKFSLEKQQLKRAIRKEVGWFNRSKRIEIYNAFLNTQNINLEEMTDLYKE